MPSFRWKNWKKDVPAKVALLLVFGVPWLITGTPIERAMFFIVVVPLIVFSRWRESD